MPMKNWTTFYGGEESTFWLQNLTRAWSANEIYQNPYFELTLIVLPNPASLYEFL